MSTTRDSALLADFSGHASGTVLLPDDAGYDAARAVHNWSRETFAAMRPHHGAGRWLNYLGDDQAEGAIRAAYGPNYERLRDVKRRLDPDNSSASITTSRRNATT